MLLTQTHCVSPWGLNRRGECISFVIKHWHVFQVWNLRRLQAIFEPLLAHCCVYEYSHIWSTTNNHMWIYTQVCDVIMSDLKTHLTLYICANISKNQSYISILFTILVLLSKVNAATLTAEYVLIPRSQALQIINSKVKKYQWCCDTTMITQGTNMKRDFTLESKSDWEGGRCDRGNMTVTISYTYSCIFKC